MRPTIRVCALLGFVLSTASLVTAQAPASAREPADPPNS